MKVHVIHPGRFAGASFAALQFGWLLIVPTVDAETARAELKDARGVRVGEASLQDTPEGVKVSATFSELPPGEHAIHVHAAGRCDPPFESAGAALNPPQRYDRRDTP